MKILQSIITVSYKHLAYETVFEVFTQAREQGVDTPQVA